MDHDAPSPPEPPSDWARVLKQSRDRHPRPLARWAVEQGLGFGQLPLLDDPDVIKAYSAWVDVDLWRKQLELARARRQADGAGHSGALSGVQHGDRW